MMEFKTGDILQSDVEALVNTVNCVGIMGRGVALQFKTKFPQNFKAYAAACNREEVQPGRMFVFETGWVTGPKYIINFPTKRHWRGKSRIEDIDAGLKDLRAVVEQKKIHSIAIPPLGAGLGGLRWAQVRPKIEHALKPLQDVRIVVFEPNPEFSPSISPIKGKVPTMTAGRAALIGLMKKYLSGLLDPVVTLLEIHKLMYFLQVAGEPLALKFSQGIYGPYAENLRHVLRKIEGYYVAGFVDDGDSPSKELQLVPGAEDDAQRVLAAHPDTAERIKRVAELADGFEDSFNLELLSTVHWVAAQSKSTEVSEVIAGTYAWNDRKKQFTPRQIRLALQVLTKKGWLTSGSLN